MDNIRNNNNNHHDNGGLIVDFPNAGGLHGHDAMKRVRFSSVISEVKIIQRHGSQQLALLWTSSEERANYRRSLKQDVGHMRRLLQLRTQATESITKEEVAQCVGIENLLSTSVFRRLVNKRREHSEAILSEARRQAALDIHDQESMRHVSERFSMWSVERARHVAEEYFNMDDCEDEAGYDD